METPPPIVFKLEQPPINYTELGIFISGLLLSLGGCFAVVSSQLRRSNCKEVSCGCFNMKRENMNIDDSPV